MEEHVEDRQGQPGSRLLKSPLEQGDKAERILWATAAAGDQERYLGWVGNTLEASQGEWQAGVNKWELNNKQQFCFKYKKSHR